MCMHSGHTKLVQQSSRQLVNVRGTFPPTRRNRTSGLLSPNGFEVRPRNHPSSSWHLGNMTVQQVAVMALTGARVTPCYPFNARESYLDQAASTKPFREFGNRLC